MQSIIKFIHISDTHISAQGCLVYDNNPRVKLQTCIDEIKRDHLDAAFLILTGDVTNDGSMECFSFLQEVLSELPMPWYLVMGNHDLKQSLFTAIPEYPRDPNGFVQFTVDTPVGLCIILDTTIANQSSGILCAARLDWLANELKQATKPVLLFFHHPPFSLGIPSMDAIVHSLKNSEEFFAVLKPYKDKIRHMFVGHIHRPICGSWNGIPFSCAPSTAHQIALNFQSDKSVLGFKEPSGYSIVLVNNDQLIVHFQECNKTPNIIIKA
ncbi:phosphodiesterase [Lawsonia intracellularis]|uniref:Phosphodiesterase n=1 Tax=Lawsonia intracellularis (strain PHE/MN1-00) TaxID=363253 RepID=Q1MS94_LAWIP|nr:phosphodiesterase [Lawsonia intracellularis]AGC49475.1 phosphodiesterase [Lawsonia intracellularis N343]KAA0204996.1 phosphodiesterase [Lawsonia intracellularis]MBZ3892480.1 phosphodiesterase [Lawsonia intracellularis]RBN32455.1 phosphodiesterase [Lawsonia intracellularis]RBN34021.1 phosphodiesterase [Lawsonia intracellularis]